MVQQLENRFGALTCLPKGRSVLPTSLRQKCRAASVAVIAVMRAPANGFCSKFEWSKDAFDVSKLVEEVHRVAMQSKTGTRQTFAKPRVQLVPASEGPPPKQLGRKDWGGRHHSSKRASPKFQPSSLLLQRGPQKK